MSDKETMYVIGTWRDLEFKGIDITSALIFDIFFPRAFLTGCIKAVFLISDCTWSNPGLILDWSELTLCGLNWTEGHCRSLVRLIRY